MQIYMQLDMLLTNLLAGSESSPGKKANHSYAGGSSNHSNSGNHSGSHERNRASSNSKDKNDVRRHYILVSIVCITDLLTSQGVARSVSSLAY